MQNSIKIEICADTFINVPSNLKKIYKNFEPLTTKIIRECLLTGQTFVDIGANIGYFSLLASKCVGVNGRVYAIEASPAVLPMLAANVAGRENVEIVNSAVGERKGDTDFYLTEDYVNSGVSLNPFLSDAKKINIPIDTLDDLLGEIDVDFIKCDVQGDEIAVLNGAHQLISRSARLSLVIEWAPTWMKNAGYDPAMLPEALKSLGFDNIVILDDWLSRVLSVDQMQTEFSNDKTARRFCNIFARKGFPP